MDGDQPGTEYLDVETEARGLRSPGDRPVIPAAATDCAAAELAFTRRELAGLGLSPHAEARAA
jgi:hypothetical protein